MTEKYTKSARKNKKKRKSEKRYILCPILSKILFSVYGIILERLNVKKICLKCEEKLYIL
jgi:hypothetical protein